MAATTAADTTPRNSILRISDEKTMELIELYQKEECLWNTKLEDYKNKEKRMKAYQRIAKKLNIPKFEAKHVTMKFKNLRNSYSQELKKIALNHSYGDEEYRPKVFWFSKMDSFIRPHLQPARGSAYEHMVYQAENASGSDRDERGERGVTDREDASDVCHTELLILPDTSLRDHSDDDTTYRNKRKSSTSNEYGKRIKVETEEQDYDDPNELILPDASTSYSEDIYDHFGRYVASLLRSLPQNQAISLQPKIVKMITESMTSASET